MEIGKYVFTVQMEDKDLLINLTNGKTIGVPRDYLQSMLNKEETIDDKTLSYLTKWGFVVDSKNKVFHLLNDVDLSINMNLTNVCNFHCQYCYFRANNQEKIKTSIDENQFLSWLSDLALRDKKNIYINYLGGEPLIEARKMLYISEHVFQMAEHFSIKYFGEVTTNGYYLTPELAQKMVAAGIRTVQITFDGNREDHNGIRNCGENHGTYDRIIENIKACKEIINISVRINIHKGMTVEHTRNLLEDLRSIGAKYVYFATIEDNYIGEKDSAENNQYALNDEEAIDQYVNMWKLQKEMGFDFIQKIPPVVSNCIAHNTNGYTINYDGKIFLCPSTCGMDKYLIDDIYHYKGNKKTDKVVRENCKECTLFPICMGGCEVANNVLGDNKACRKDYISKMLTNYLSIKNS